ncbi:MAG: hypothetical protein KDC71_23835, partial [Acidobacteria bacterium]|nr:hypothetical protein [Acidobacteriota bacterium]
RKFIESKPYAFQGIGYSFEEALINLARLFDVPKNEANDLQWIAEAFGWDRLRWFLRGSWLIV